MSGDWDFRLDYYGVRDYLRGDPDLRRVINEYADRIAVGVRARIDPEAVVEVRRYTSDRGAASVAIRDVRGMGWQARDGVLTRAAAATGLEVREYR